METKIRAVSRLDTSVKVDVKATQAGDMFSAQGGAMYEDITRGPHAFHVQATTAVAAVIALPSVATALMVWNSAPDGGRSMVIDAIGATCETGSGVVSQMGMIWVLGQTRVATVANDLIARRNNGLGATTDTVAIIAEGGNLDGVTGVAIGWVPWGRSTTSAVISLTGTQFFHKVNGKIIISPGRAFGLHVMSSDVDSDFICGMMWHEETIRLA